ncbi:alcohol dehydrogenase [NADP(+)] [Lates japonicus]|uniref:Alcohol dehydrogenase [NADP(+)] n=1 Tax=Lates japonicus TaxID=270547 RepID=A0AAD3MT22_LATJO|nr:alcohol dehydrogenase [NADP(+)] [Lates japonicus]
MQEGEEKLRALCGCTVSIPTLENRVISLPCHDIIKPGTVKRLRGEGLPFPKNPSQRDAQQLINGLPTRATPGPQSWNMSTFVTLSTGQKMPMVGLGTWKSAPGQVKQAVLAALDCGYRHIDCAAAYSNEQEVGAALALRVGPGKALHREEVFVTSKLWNTKHDPDDVEEAYWSLPRPLPHALAHGISAGEELMPRREDGSICYSDTHYRLTWTAMESLLVDKASRIQQNLQVFDFSLSEGDMKLMNRPTLWRFIKSRQSVSR